MARSFNHIVLFCAILVLAASGGGCQRGPVWNLAPVEGVVTKDGYPLCGIEVVFVPDADTVGPRSRGITDEAGRYRLCTGNGDDGAAVGAHRVCLHDTHHISLKSLGPLSKKVANAEGVQKSKKDFNEKAASAPPRVPPSYGRPSETPLRVEVQPGPQVIDLEVK
jgi:hypothetical protein